MPMPFCFRNECGFCSPAAVRGVFFLSFFSEKPAGGPSLITLLALIESLPVAFRQVTTGRKFGLNRHAAR